jgi:RNA polymerase sigma-70 factor (ECF subfamily)
VTLSEASIDELLELVRHGDEAALASLIGGLRDRVFRWALVITGDADDADDVAQQVSIALHRKLGDFKGQSRFTTWLYSIVRNAALGLMSTASRKHESPMHEDQRQQSLSDGVADQLERMASRRTAALIRSFFTELPQRQRELIEMIDTQGYTAAEAARIMGIEPETARGHLLRARRTLRAKMLEQHPETFT